MTQELTFQISFRGPFLVSTGNARAGADATIDPTVPLPTTALKGVLRAELLEALGIRPDHFARYFRDRGDRLVLVVVRAADEDAGCGHFSCELGKPDPPQSGRRRGRRIPGDSGRCVGRYCDDYRDPCQTPRRRDLAQALAAPACGPARSVSALGSNRRRGHGWVRISDVDPAAGNAVANWTAHDSEQLLRLRGGLHDSLALSPQAAKPIDRRQGRRGRA